MYMNAMVTECDVTGARYDAPVAGSYAVARGATGRWCVVLAFGPEATKQHAGKLLSEDDVRNIVEAKGEWLDY
jgi:hypothetical protein